MKPESLTAAFYLFEVMQSALIVTCFNRIYCYQYFNPGSSFDTKSKSCPRQLLQIRSHQGTVHLCDSPGHAAICGMDTDTAFVSAWYMNCVYFLDKLFLNISSFLLIEEETHASMTFLCWFTHKLFPCDVHFYYYCRYYSKCIFFCLVNKILLTAKWKEEKLITLK